MALDLESSADARAFACGAGGFGFLLPREWTFVSKLKAQVAGYFSISSCMTWGKP
jgi:hypothetical protein